MLFQQFICIKVWAPLDYSTKSSLMPSILFPFIPKQSLIILSLFLPQSCPNMSTSLHFHRQLSRLVPYLPDLVQSPQDSLRFIFSFVWLFCTPVSLQHSSLSPPFIFRVCKDMNHVSPTPSKLEGLALNEGTLPS